MPEMILYGVLFIIPGVLFLLFPKAFLKYAGKLKYKEAEPPDSLIIAGKTASVIGILTGIALIAFGFFPPCL